MGGGLSRHDSPSVADTSAPSNLDKDQMLAQAEKEMGFRIDHLNRFGLLFDIGLLIPVSTSVLTKGDKYNWTHTPV
ncbi:unnamed protein product [Musa hybrid cultivar]